jgi:DNA-binding NtrC family response regulator
MRTPAATTKVLILARESVIAALIGLLLELEAYEPVFPEPGERYEDAIRRVRPPLVVVLDGESDEARSDLFHARAAPGGARVVLFSEPVAADAVRAAARERRLPFFAMPVDRATLGTVLKRAAGA